MPARVISWSWRGQISGGEAMRLSETTQEILFLLFCLLIGCLAAGGALLFRAMIELGQWLLWPQGFNFFQQVLQAPWWWKLLLPTLAGLAIGPIIVYLAPQVRGPGVPEVIEAAALRDGYIAPRITILKPLCTVLIISAGGSVGREGPVVHIGSALGSTLAQVLGLNPERTRICLACGAAAGIAATFNAPFAGTMFAVEIILADLQIAYLSHIVLAAVAATVISRRFLGNFPTVAVPSFVLAHHGELILHFILGGLAGLVALLFIRGVFATDTLVSRLPMPAWLQPAVGGLLLGLLGLLCPHVFGVGYDSINLMLAGKIALAASVLILATKYLATVVCLGSGMSGGIFAPSLVVGASLGTTLALSARMLFPQFPFHPADYVLVGMGAVVSGTTLAPMTAILTIFELTNTYSIIVPAMVACIPSMLVVRYLYGYSIYETKLLRKGVNIVRGHEVSILRSLKVKDHLMPHLEVLQENTPLHEILRRADASRYPFFVVQNDQEDLAGVLTLWDLRHVLLNAAEQGSLVAASDLMSKEVVTISPTDNFETALNKLEGHNFSYLPVVAPEAPRKVMGVLRLDDMLAVYDEKVLKENLLRKPRQRLQLPFFEKFRNK
jgi:CIC family chloride channel protein